jgi:hypothetical protein
MFHVRGIIGSADAAGEQSRLLKSYGVVWPECNFLITIGSADIVVTIYMLENPLQVHRGGRRHLWV